MGTELALAPVMVAAALALAIQLLASGMAVNRRAGIHAIRTRLQGAAAGDQRRNVTGRHAVTDQVNRLMGSDLPSTALFCLAATGGLIGLLLGQIMSLPMLGRALMLIVGSLGVVAWRCRKAATRFRNLGSLVSSFLRELHLSAAAGETASRSLAHACERAPEPLHSLLHQAWLAVQAGEDMATAYGRLQPLVASASYQGFVYALWLHEKTGASLGELLGVVLDQADEALLAQGELSARLAEARWTARVLAVIPVALLVFLRLAQPDLVLPLASDPIGRQALAVGFCLWLAGIGVSTQMQRPPRGLRREV